MHITSLLRATASRQFQIYQCNRRVRRYRSRTLDKLFASVEQSVDVERIRRLRREMRTAYRADVISAAKYADHPLWLWQNIGRAAGLGLHDTPALRILDLGCGPGYFMAVARALGHECDGVDLPEWCFTPLQRRVYSEMLEALKCRSYVSSFAINRYEKVPLSSERYDLITAFQVCFNRHKQPDEWSVGEWRFFVEDALRRLRPGGRLYLVLNENPERHGKLRWYDAPTLAYFQSVGVVTGKALTIPNPVAGHAASFRGDEKQTVPELF
jgi:SAM-dependent methyltransferase